MNKIFFIIVHNHESDSIDKLIKPHNTEKLLQLFITTHTEFHNIMLKL